MTIKTIAENLNKRSSNYKIGQLQEIRKRIKRLKKISTAKIFSSRTIFDEYAFHDGGRTEMQYNIGFEDSNLLRYGLAFSLEPGQTLPDVSVLYPKILKYNILFRSNPGLFTGYKMWAVTPDGRTKTEKIHEIDSSLLKPDVFIFFGKLMDLSNINYDAILKTFDNMLPIYEDILPDDNNKISDKRAASSPGGFVKTYVKLPQGRKYTREQLAVDIDIRHSKIQEALERKLIKEYGENNVSLEHPIFQNKRIDAVVNDNGKLYFYEIKPDPTARDCIRQAMGQILDYAYWPGRENAAKLFIVGENEIDKATQNYLRYLNTRFKLALEYIEIAL
jgi:hypothetical protein